MLGIKYNARKPLLCRFWCDRRRGIYAKSAFKKRFWKDICLSFISMHYVYIVLWAIVASIIIYPGSEISYIDALFFGSAAATQSGLNTIDLNRMKTYQQIVIWTVAMVTNPIFIHTAVVFVRIYWFEKRFKYLVQSARTTRRSGSTVASGSDGEQQQDGDSVNPEEQSDSQAGSSMTPYLSWNVNAGRNSAFIGLTEAQREELGGIEYRALKTLAVILIFYYSLFHIFGILCLVPWIMKSTTYGPVVREAGQGRPWWAVFTSGSAFNDFGLTLIPDSMETFQKAVFPLLIMTFLIIIGNTGFPCMLRFIIWIVSKVVTRNSPLWAEVRFLLDHPRRCFTLLFPQAASWWIFATVVLFNVASVVLFIVLNLNTPEIKTMPGGIRFLDGLFQGAATRTAGFQVVKLSKLHPATLVMYMVMMYVAVFPIAISVRRTNVYEEQSLGLYSNSDERRQGQNSKEPSYIGIHLRRQLGSDFWYMFLGLFIIAVVEGNELGSAEDPHFTLFSALFEIVSAYGTVGLSLGYPDKNVSFVGGFHTLSKLVIIAMQIRGRHRGLPYALDHSVLLPSESLHKSELAEVERHIQPCQNTSNRLHAVQSHVQLPYGTVGEGSHAEHRLGIGAGLSNLANIV